MNFKIDVVVACAAGAMTGLSLGMCWELHHHYIMCRPRKRGWRSQAIYQHSLLIYSWPLHSEPLLTALKYRSEIIAPSRPRISMCDRHGGIRVLPECDGFVPGCNPLSYFYLFFFSSSKLSVSGHSVSWLSTWEVTWVQEAGLAAANRLGSVQKQPGPASVWVLRPEKGLSLALPGLLKSWYLEKMKFYVGLE